MAKKPTQMVNIEVDGKPLAVPSDQYLLWSLREAGFDIPHFCAHKWLEPFGGCRMCLAKIELGGKMMPKLQTTCSMKPAEGMKVLTQHPDVLQVRKEQLEFHLLNHPLECPVCDKGGECMLQNQTMDHGCAAGRYIEQKRIRPDTHFNDYIRMNYKRCIHCKRCIHFCSDIDGSYLLQFVERGADTYIESFPNPDEAPRFSGNVIDICPVGALTAQSYRFMGRPWEQEHTASIGSLDSVGANIWICNRLGKIARIIPRDNPDVENGLIDDATRFHWECFEDSRRVRKAVQRQNGSEEQISIAAGEEQAGKLLGAVMGEHGPGSIGIIAGGGLNNEDYLALKRFASEVLETPYYYFGSELFGADPPSLQTLQALIGHVGSISEILTASTVLNLGCDVFEEAPALGLRLDIAARRGHQTLLAARSHRSECDRFASHYADYGYGNLRRLVIGVTNALTGKGETFSEAEALAEQLRAVGEDCAVLFGDEVWRDEHPQQLIAALAALRDAVQAASPACQAVYLCPIYPEVNTAGALLINYLEHFGPAELPRNVRSSGSLRAVLQAAATGKLKILLVVDADVLNTYADRALVERAFKSAAVVYCGPFTSPTAEMAELHLPLGTYAHRDGTVLSFEWRLQKRCRSELDTVAPSVLEVLESLCSAMDYQPIADTVDVLAQQLSELVTDWPQAAYADFPQPGLLLKPKLQRSTEAPAADANLPAEFKANTEEPLVLIPKRFLYDDRAELRFSHVFDPVKKPFYAFMNPLDMKVMNISEGDSCSFGTKQSAVILTVRSGQWVRTGSVVINAYYLNQPANHVCGATPVRVAAQRAVRTSGGK